MTYVRDDVLAASPDRQHSFIYGSLPGRGNFYFVAVKQECRVDDAEQAGDVRAGSGD
jgi:hypothetical protein